MVKWPAMSPFTAATWQENLRQKFHMKSRATNRVAYDVERIPLNAKIKRNVVNITINHLLF
jgi:hypothetical protein